MRTEVHSAGERAPERAPFVLASVSRLHIVGIAALGTLTFGWLFTGERPVLLAAICALDWFLVNILNRVVDLDEDRANHIAGTDLVARREGLIRGLGLAVLAGSFVVTHLVAPAITPYRVAYHSLGLAYNWPIFGRRIKQLYFFKNTASALGFVLTVFAYPLAELARQGRPLAPGITPATIGFALVFFFLFEVSYEVIYDLRDVAGDRIANVRTYPVVHGERVAVRIVDALLAGSILALALGFALGVVPVRLLIMIAAPLLQAVLYKRALRRGITSRDCIALTWIGAALLAVFHLWVALDLPFSTS